jgi:hypothetical protein
MVEIVSDRPLFKTILVEMAYCVIHLHNRVNKVPDKKAPERFVTFQGVSATFYRV